MEPLMILGLVCASLVALYGTREGVLTLAAGGSRPEGTAWIVVGAVAGVVTYYVVVYGIIFVIALLLVIGIIRAMAG